MNKNDIDSKDYKSSFDWQGRIYFRPVSTDADAVYAKIWHKLRYENSIPVGISPVWKYVSVAASLVLLIVSTILVSVYTKNEPLSYLEVSAVPGTKVKVVLPDSSTVWLNSNAMIRYPQQFSENIRSVEFMGEALFQVRHDEKRPFVVNAEDLKIKVLGTSFNVFSSKEKGIVETTLLDGSIALFSSHNHTAVADIVLSPNQQALYNKKNGHIDVLNVCASSYASWTNGNFIFEKNTLQEIASSLERAFNVKIHIQDEELLKERLTARFTHQETLDEILSVLQISAQYKYKKEKGEIYITKR